MASEITRDEAMYCLLFFVAARLYKSGIILDDAVVTKKELVELERIKKLENFKLGSSIKLTDVDLGILDSNKKSLEFYGSTIVAELAPQKEDSEHHAIWTKCCDVLRSASKLDQLMTIFYMYEIARVEDEGYADEAGASKIAEAQLIEKTAESLGVTSEELSAIANGVHPTDIG